MVKSRSHSDVLLIGAGIMSATLGTLLKFLQPDWHIQVVERLEGCALESSGALNNAGTGHSGFCELNYTPQNKNGEIEIAKAVKVCEAFEKSKQFWSRLVKEKCIGNNFIFHVPHISFVRGKENVDYLRRRWLAMKQVCLFADMEFTDDVELLKEWMPLMMRDRKITVPLAASRIKRGTDIDFGLLTENLLGYISRHNGHIAYNQEVISLERERDLWKVTLRDRISRVKHELTAAFVFIGAGGTALNLLEKSGIREVKGYGGFPVSGQWFICGNPRVVQQHEAKVYGMPSIGAPPMSVPHLDTRIINGKRSLLFGPYAGFTTRFLKHGSWTDFFRSINLSNIGTLISAGFHNMDLTWYLVREVMKTKRTKFKTLIGYYPDAQAEDWKLAMAGQRVQVIKRENGRGVIEFGTEIVSSADGSIAALLGASPGASTSVKIMTDLLQKCFGQREFYPVWMEKLGEAIPSGKKPLHEDPELFAQLEKESAEVLNLC